MKGWGLLLTLAAVKERVREREREGGGGGGGGGGEADRGRNRDRDLGRGGLVRRAPPTEDAAPLKKRQRHNSESQQTPQQ